MDSVLSTQVPKSTHTDIAFQVINVATCSIKYLAVRSHRFRAILVPYWRSTRFSVATWRYCNIQRDLQIRMTTCTAGASAALGIFSGHRESDVSGEH